MLDYIHEKYDHCMNPIQAKNLQLDLKEHYDKEISLTTIRKILKIELGMSYKKIYRGNILANTIRAKQKRQYAAVLFARLLA